MATIYDIGIDCFLSILFFASLLPENWFSLRLVNKFWNQKCISLQNPLEHNLHFLKLNIRKGNENMVSQLLKNEDIENLSDYLDLLKYCFCFTNDFNIFSCLYKEYKKNSSIHERDIPLMMIVNNIVEKKDYMNGLHWLNYVLNQDYSFIKYLRKRITSVLVKFMDIRYFDLVIEKCEKYFDSESLYYSVLCNYGFRNCDVPKDILDYFVFKQNIKLYFNMEELLNMNEKSFSRILKKESMINSQMESLLYENIDSINDLLFNNLVKYYPFDSRRIFNSLFEKYLKEQKWNRINNLLLSKSNCLNLSVNCNYLLCYSLLCFKKEWITILLKDKYVIQCLETSNLIIKIKQHSKFDFISILLKETKKQHFFILGLILCYCFNHEGLITVNKFQTTKIIKEDMEKLNTKKSIELLIRYYNKL